MSEFVINDKTAGTSIGELARKVETDSVTLVNADGETIGWIGPPPKPLPPMSPEELEILRHRLRSDDSEWLTKTELLARLHALTADE